MLEIPEALVMSEQITQTLKGRRIMNVTANTSPHKFAWYYGEPEKYHDLLADKTIDQAVAHGGMVEIQAGPARIVLGDGVNIRWFAPGEKLPAKHQLHVEFDDFSSLVCSLQMYGGLYAFPAGQFDYSYYEMARTKPSPLAEQFDESHFESLLAASKLTSLSAKAFLATEQRIPGLGNGVLQDILWTARINPKRKMATLSQGELSAMFGAIKSVLAEMAAGGGRDTERDLFGCPGGYITRLSKNTAGHPCPECRTIIKKEAYMGGSIYYCAGCQLP